MNEVLKTINLNYRDFRNINLVFNRGKFYIVIGSSNCGKTTLFKLLASLIPTDNMIYCNNILLNEDNYYEYLVNMGIVERVNRYSFVYKKVIDEMMYPLYNLGYSKKNILNRINELLSFFDIDYFIDKNINELSYLDKQKLLIIISLLHKPSVLLLDSVLEIFPKNDSFIKKLKKLVKNGLTVISFTKKLDLEVDKIILLDNYSVLGEYLPSKVYEDDKLFYSHNIEIPFITDLSIKLKMYDLLDKEYTDMKEMVDKIWP